MVDLNSHFDRSWPFLRPVREQQVAAVKIKDIAYMSELRISNSKACNNLCDGHVVK
eukprot:gene26366-biopygen16119